MSTLDAAVADIQKEFAISAEHLNTIVDAFVSQAESSLAKSTPRALPMIPTYITGIPSGQEEGLFLAADLGGTNFRVCSVMLDGKHGYKLEQQKWPVPKDLMVGESKDFFNFLADKVKDFLCQHHQEHFATEKVNAQVELKMGFTFSFPVNQTSINRGTLIRWTKGFEVKGVEGKDVCLAFQESLDRLDLRVHIAALINDTVGALMARAYTNTADSQTIIGAIFGTGTNAAYFEKLVKITKCGEYENTLKSDNMAVNTEWGSFDNDLTVLPNTSYDAAVDKDTSNPGIHMLEKRISGLYLGEIFRRVLLDFQKRGLVFQSKPASSSAEVAEHLTKPFATDTSIPSKMEADKSADLSESASLLLAHFGYETSLEERKAILAVAHAIGLRSAYLSAGAVAGVLKLTNALDVYKSVDLGGDGSVFEFYPGFQENLRKALAQTFIGDRVDRITFGYAKDGSGIGAALCARMA